MAFILEVLDERGARLGGGCILRDHYRFADWSHVTVDADIAWCRACRAFALVERLPSVAELEREAEEYFFTKYPEERTVYMQPVMRQALTAAKNGLVAKHRSLLDYLPHRQSLPRCLECSGTDFVRFEQWERWYEHPSGRGRFRIICRGHIDATLYRLYNPEGLPMTR